MLRLQKMELIGFKSFSSRTEVLFPEGITAVVGPNGCGKSNIGDAISWVLGEQSAKSLRGDKMEDVIFNGSVQMKPMGMAEVSLRLVHENGASGDGEEEIILTRRLFRSGESEYSVNGERCRLKDIADLLSQTRIGAKTCAVIEQGRVEEIMNARPVERRLIIEEAAGIIGYKGKRKIAEAKLEATQGNLLRVQDIVNEVERQMRSLKRQASRARRYSKLKEAIREKQAILFIKKNEILLSKRLEIEEVLNRLKGEEAERLAQMGVVEATIERGRQELSQGEDDLARMVEQVHDLDKKIHERESNAKNTEEKVIEIESSTTRMLESLQAYQIKISDIERSISEKEKEKSLAIEEKERFQLQIEEHEKELNDIKEKEARINKSLEEEREHLFKEASLLSEIRNRSKMHEMEKKKLEVALEKKRGAVEEEKKNVQAMKESLSGVKAIRMQSDQELSTLRSQQLSLSREREQLHRSITTQEQGLSQIKVRFNSLKEKEDIYKSPEVVQGAIDAGTQAILDGKIAFEREHTGLVADWIKAEGEFEKAVEGYLVEVLPALYVSTIEDAIDGMKKLKDEKAGSGKFMFIPEQNDTDKQAEIPPKIYSHESFMGRLSEKVHFEDGIEKNLKALLDHCIVVQDIDTARIFYHWHPYLNYVTPDGEVIRSKEGLACYVREGRGEGSLLTLKNRLASIKKEIESAEVDLINREKNVQKLKEEVFTKERKQEEIMERINGLEKEMLSLEHDEKRYLEKLAYAEKKSQILQEELSIMKEERKSVMGYFDEAVNSVSAAEEAYSKKEEKIKDLKEECGRLKEQVLKKSKALSSLYEVYAVPSGRAASLETDVMHLKENLKDLKNRVEETRMEESAGRDRIQALKDSNKISEEAIERMVQERIHSQEQSEKLRGEITSRKESLSSQEQEIKQIRMKLDEIRVTLKENEVERTEIRGEIKHNAEVCQEELLRGIEEVEDLVTTSEEINEEEVAQEILELKEKIQRIGPINMMAIEEYDKLEERYQFLSKQRKDLTDSIESLTETIRKINRTSRMKFQEAFQGINEGFDEIFKILFNGGHAELRLEDEKDILESGIEITAQPPGKKLQNMNLLSGGEKALTVIALLFSVFRFQPSPFCLLDEVDSALDDANIGKFINMLKGFSEKTQFILITHNKKTMEVANLLYGVTMEEPGISKIVSLKLN